MISSIRPKQSISAKEMPKNHTDKERFAAASSCFATGILTLLFPAQTTAFLSQSIISHRVLEAVASRILKSLIIRVQNFVVSRKIVIITISYLPLKLSVS